MGIREQFERSFILAFVDMAATSRLEETSGMLRVIITSANVSRRPEGLISL
jgi:hypothetical protein